MAILNGTLMTIRFNSGEGFIIGSFMIVDEKGNSSVINAKGKMMNPNLGLEYRMKGEWFVDPKWGHQFVIEQAERIQPKTIPGIRNYLIKIAPGVGPAVADSIVRNFGINTLEELKKEGSEVIVANLVKGISQEGAKKIRESLIANDINEALMIKLVEKFSGIVGIFKSLPEKCIHKWQSDAFEIIDVNPYKLTEIKGVGFPMADSVALKAEFPRDGMFRKKACIKYIIKQIMNDGHIWVNRLNLESELGKYIGYNCDDAIKEMLEDLELSVSYSTQDQMSFEYFALKSVDHAEKEIARMVMDLVYSNLSYLHAEKMNDIIDNETGKQYSLDESQINAVNEALLNNIIVVYGYAGAGKTTVLKEIINQMTCNGIGVAVACPTGKAAKRASETTGIEATTIHRLLKCIPDNNGDFTFEHNENKPIPIGCVILDEVSMVDNSLMYSLLKAIDPIKTRLILVGDPGQLPSVGPGQIFKDIIDSDRVPKVELITIHRNGGILVESANKVRVGSCFMIPNGFDPEPKLRDENDVIMNLRHIETSSQEETLDQIIEYYCGYFPAYFKDKETGLSCDPVKDVQILSPYREKTILGCEHINNVIQSRINKNYDKSKLEDQKFFVGDKVLNNKNGDINGFYIVNGDTGIVCDVTDKFIAVHFKDYDGFDKQGNFIETILKFEGTERKQLQLSYAMTIHKSQGSEYRFVILPVDDAFTFFADRRLVYTAMTRGKSGVVTIGSFGAIRKMVSNDRRIIRNTRLIRRLGEFDL